MITMKQRAIGALTVASFLSATLWTTRQVYAQADCYVGLELAGRVGQSETIDIGVFVPPDDRVGGAFIVSLQIDASNQLHGADQNGLASSPRARGTFVVIDHNGSMGHVVGQYYKAEGYWRDNRTYAVEVPLDLPEHTIDFLAAAFFASIGVIPEDSVDREEIVVPGSGGGGAGGPGGGPGPGGGEPGGGGADDWDPAELEDMDLEEQISEEDLEWELWYERIRNGFWVMLPALLALFGRISWAVPGVGCVMGVWNTFDGLLEYQRVGWLVIQTKDPDSQRVAEVIWGIQGLALAVTALSSSYACYSTIAAIKKAIAATAGVAATVLWIGLVVAYVCLAMIGLMASIGLGIYIGAHLAEWIFGAQQCEAE